MFPVSLCDSLPRIIIVPITVINSILFLELYLFFVRIIGCLFPPAACEQQRFEHEATVCLGFCGRMLSSSNYSVMCSCYWVFVLPLLAHSNVWNTKQHYVEVCVDATSEDYVDDIAGLFCFVLFFFPVPSSPLPGLVRTKKKEPRTPYLLPLSPPFGVCVDGLRIVVCLHTFCVLRICICFEVFTNELASIIVLILFIPYLLSVLLGSFLFRFSLFRASYHDDLFYCVAWPGLEPFRPSPLTTYIHILHTYIHIYEAHSPPSHNTPQLTRTPAGGSPNNTNTPRISVIIVVTHILRFFVVPASIHKHDVIVGAALFVKIGKDFGSWVTVVIFDDLRK